MWELWFLNSLYNWEYVDAFTDYETLVQGCNELQQYARVILQSQHTNASSCFGQGWQGGTRSSTILSLIEPNKTMAG